MKLQVDPDGIGGHAERDVIQEISKRGHPKQRFVEGRNFHVYTVPLVTKSKQRELDLHLMKAQCQYVTRGCNIKNCPTCGRPTRMQSKDMVRGRHDLIALRMRDPTDDKISYWKTNIAFSCPLTNNTHAIKDCFRWCKYWGATVDFENNKRGITLYCNRNPKEMRELHTGKTVGETS